MSEKVTIALPDERSWRARRLAATGHRRPEDTVIDWISQARALTPGSFAMDPIKAAVRQGRLELEAPPDWPDGIQVLIEPMAAPSQTMGIEESEWRDVPASLADWDAWIRAIEPLEFTPEEAQRMADFDEQMCRYNLEAVRHQMEQGPGNEALPARHRHRPGLHQSPQRGLGAGR